MSEYLGKNTREPSPEPLQQFLQGFEAWPGGKPGNPLHRIREVQSIQSYMLDAFTTGEHGRGSVAAQLATSLRLQGLDDEANVMLDLLVTLVQAGEISFADYIRRAENLFPQQFGALDAVLRQKISAHSAQ